MTRPEIEDYLKYIDGHCGKTNFEKFCDNWGCETVKDLCEYILLLEKLLKEFEEDIE